VYLLSVRICILQGPISVVAKVASATCPAPVVIPWILELTFVSYWPRICYLCYKYASFAAFHYKQKSQLPIPAC